MSMDTPSPTLAQEKPATQPPFSMTRELAILKFNHRVLLQATRPDFPILEKVRFLSIFSNNLDEFFSAHISTFFVEKQMNKENLTPEHVEVLKEAQFQREQAGLILNKVKMELGGGGIHIVNPENLTKNELAYFSAYLAEEVVPKTDMLDPEALSDLGGKALYLTAGWNHITYLIRVPDNIPRFLEIPSRPHSFVDLCQVMRLRRDLFLPEPVPLYELRINRLATVEMYKVEWEDLPDALIQRGEGRVTRVEIEKNFPWEEELRRAFSLHPLEIFRTTSPLNLSSLTRLCNLPRPDLLFMPFHFRRYPNFSKDPFSYLYSQDLALWHPKDDFRVVERFLESAVHDVSVDKIRITGYRLGRRSKVADLLMEGARRGKDVAIVLEGRARFDELQNLDYNLHFTSSGVSVLPLGNLKVHAKVMLVRQGGKNFVHLGTGNYNSVNARLYTDLSLLTARSELTNDAETFFNSFELGEQPKLRCLLWGRQARSAMIERIAREATFKTDGHIIIKMNHLTDQKILDALVEAADAGVRVELLIRTTLTLLYHKWTMRSIVGRFLEHARIAAFKNGGNWDLWCGSADWMPRSFEKRFELIFPIYDNSIKKRILDLLFKQARDDRNGFDLLPDGTHHTRWSGRFDAQSAKL
eukprot:TRINITY_DN4381_c0_g1_i4.p1 TRINITY_DN4381_c0_g1~~TRINITY_DN4381_c0_g1_i4.p1  ORF type:complete len:641 (-),score=106.98 TRINITY_DN4381_c0_g1_i4:267-2189(-)